LDDVIGLTIVIIGRCYWFDHCYYWTMLLV
jgi:hypothetical protein